MELSYLDSRNQANTFRSSFTPSVAFWMTSESIVKGFIVCELFFGMAD